MIETTILFKGFLFGTIGTAFGWSLNQVSHWITAKKEDKRYIRLVLFNLLEAYDIFNRADINKYVSFVVQEITPKLVPELQKKEEKEALQKFFYDFAEKTMLPELLKELKILQPKYETSILNLAPIDPITSYYLSGKASLLDRFETIQVLLKDAIDKFSPAFEDSSLEVNKFVSNLKPDLMFEAINDMEIDIKKISKKIGFRTYFDTRSLIKKIKTSPNERAKLALDKMLSHLNPSC